MKIRIVLIALFAIVFAECSHTHKDGDEQKHTIAGQADDHEEAKFQYTAYTSSIELFAESDPFISGEISNVLSHFTLLPAFEPLENASVTIRLKIEGQEVIQTLETPIRQGIYSFNIIPVISGEGIILFDIKSESGNYSIGLENVTVFENETDAHEAAEAEGAALSSVNSYFFTKEQSWKIDFATEPVTRKKFGQIIKTSAQVESAPGDQLIISAKTNGIVKFSGSNLLEGQPISKGKNLCTLEGSGLSENNSAIKYLEAQNNLEKATADLERLTALSEDKIISEKELLEARNKYDNAKIQFEILSGNFSSGGQVLTSPIDGYLMKNLVKEGQYVESGQPLFSISQNKTLVLHADVQQKYASDLEKVSDATIRLVAQNKVFSLNQLNGKVFAAGKLSNSENYLIPIRVKIDNNGEFIPGGFVELYLHVNTNKEEIVVPDGSLLEEQGNYFVFVQITPESFEKREVKKGSSDGFETKILKGLNEGERIVTKGAVFIKLAKGTEGLDAHSGHVH